MHKHLRSLFLGLLLITGTLAPAIVMASPLSDVESQVGNLIESLRTLSGATSASQGAAVANVAAALAQVKQAAQPQGEVLGASKGPVTTPAPMSDAVLTANHLQVVGPGQFAVEKITNGPTNGPTQHFSQKLPDGYVYEADVPSNTTIRIFGPHTGGYLYVPIGDADISVQDESSVQGASDQADSQIIGTPQSAAADPSFPYKKSVSKRAAHSDRSPHLKDIKPIKPFDSNPDHEIHYPKLSRSLLTTTLGVSRDPLSGSSVGPQSVSTIPGLGFDGVGGSQANQGNPCNCEPPDTNGSAGTTQYVQWVNTAFAVFDKSTGTMTYGPAAGNTLWAGFGGPCEVANDGDPIIQFDKDAKRWVATQFVLGPDLKQGPSYLQCLAVSDTDDALGTWHRYSFDYGPHNFNDYPKLSVWPDGYYITYNIFADGNAFTGPMVCAFDRAAILGLAARPVTQQCVQLPGTDNGGLLPADWDGPTPPPAGTPGLILGFNYNSQNSLILYKYHVDWTNPQNSVMSSEVNIPVAPFTSICDQYCIPQAGTTNPAEGLGDRILYRLAYRNFGDHESLVVNHSVQPGSTPGSGIRWYELRNATGSTMRASTPVVYQQGTYAPDSSWRWMGSVAMDHVGDMAAGYSVSSSATYPSIRFALRNAGDPLGTLNAESTVITGTGSNVGPGRWGDYSNISVDPVDDCTMWFTTEYYSGSGAYGVWKTRVSSFRNANCVPSTVPVTFSPPFVSVTTDPTKQITSATQTIVATTAQTSLGTVSLAVNSTIPGITVTLNKQTLNLSSGTDSFQASVVADNNVVAAGYYLVYVFLNDAAGNQITKMPVIVSVTPTITVTPTTLLDFGMDDPTLSSWTSSPIAVTLTNVRTDVAQTVALAPAGFPSGVTVNTGGSSVSIPAGSSVTRNVSLTVNGAVPDATYGGTLSFNNSAGVTLASRDLKFSKFYVVNINANETGASMLGILAGISLAQGSVVFNVPPTTGNTAIYLNAPGTFTLLLDYESSFGMSQNPPLPSGESYVAKENISISQGVTNISVNAASATHVITETVNGPSKTYSNCFNSRNNFLDYASFYTGLLGFEGPIGCQFAPSYTTHFSDMSSAFKYEQSFSPSWGEITGGHYRTSELYGIANTYYNGIVADHLTAPAPGDYRTTTFPIDTSEGIPSDSMVAQNLMGTTTGLADGFGSGFGLYGTSTAPTTHAYLAPDSSGLVLGSYVATGVACATPGACTSAFSSPVFLTTSSGNTMRNFNNLVSFSSNNLPNMPASATSTMYVGLGPTEWAGKFSNTSAAIVVGYEWGFADFVRQDYALEPYDAVPFTISSGGTTVSSGSLPAFGTNATAGSSLWLSNAAEKPTPVSIPAAAGSYQFSANFPYKDAGQSFTGSVVASFNTSLADKNPPTITQLNYSTNNVLTDAYYTKGTQNTLTLGFDPNIGIMQSANVSYSTGSAYTSVAAKESGGIYTAQIPANLTGTAISIRVVGADSSGNSLTYTFALPISAATPPSGTVGGNDTVAPTVAMTSPASGTNAIGTISVSASATDNVGVTKVEFYLDANATPFGQVLTTPYATTLDTTTLTSGTHTIFAKAYDAAGNVGTSTAVTINNDQTPPSVTIISPQSGFSLSGTVAPTVTASDDVGVARVELWKDGKLLGTDTAAPYTFSWNTTLDVYGQHALQAKAYDTNGNVSSTGVMLIYVNNSNVATLASIGASPATIAAGGSTSLAWAGANATSCTGSGFNTGGTADGVITVSPQQTTTYSLTCIGTGTFSSSDTKSVTVTVSGTAPAPTATLSANPMNITTGQSSTLTWSSTNATSCTGTNFTASGTSGSVTVTPSITTTYSLTCIGSGGTSQAVSATVTVSSGSDTTPPTTAITTPLSGSTVTGTATVSATASDNVGVTKVELYKDGTLLATDTASPYTFSWDTTKDTNASHTLQTKAYDAAGNIGSSATVSVTVSNAVQPPPDTTPPTISITAPASGATVSATTSVTTAVSDNIGVAKVAFWVDNSLRITDTTSPFTFAWITTNFANGSHTLTAVASDAAGNTATSSAVTVTVSNTVTPPPDTTPPTTSITAPTTGTTVSGTATISASATDNVGVTKVELYKDGALLATDTTAPYTFTWDTTKDTNASHTLQTKAYDAAGNVGSSATISVTVANAVQPPPATATLSASPASITSGQSSTLTWSSTNATSCTGTGFATGSAVSGSVSVTPTITTTYSVTCTGAGGASAPAGATVTVASVTPSFGIGARIKVTTPLNVRTKANTNSGKILCVQPVGALGTIVGGPTTQQGYTWWNINFDTGCDGYAVQDGLTTALAMNGASPLAAITHPLAEGWSGPEVSTLQSILSYLGYLNQTATGYFGEHTAAALKAYQAANNIAAVGVVGPETRGLLDQIKF